MFSEGLNVVGFDHNGSNGTQESSPNKKFNDSNDDFSANEPSISKKMAYHMVSRVHIASEEVFEQGHI